VSPRNHVALVIWSVVAGFSLLMFASALGVFLWWHKALSSEDLKTATALRINYLVSNPRGPITKTIEVKDPVEVQKLLDALEITSTHRGRWWSKSNQGSVDFILPDGTIEHAMFVDSNQLERMNWGEVIISDAFYHRVNEVASRAEGKPIKITQVNP
jgi:hypothetical protein